MQNDKLGKLAGILKDTMNLFVKNNPLIMGGATAFFTMFALPPILIILIQVFSLFIDPKTIRHELSIGLTDVFGREVVRQLVAVIRAVRKLNYNWIAAVLVFVFLLFVATTVFKIIRNTINQIWEIKEPEFKIMTTLRARLKTLMVILVTGIIFIIGVFVETIQVMIGNYFVTIVPSISTILNQALGFVISVLIQAIWFMIIFRYLPSVRPKWNIAWIGGLFTSLLFSLGKMILHVLLTYNNINNFYGASASLVLLLLFVFYAAMILYFGAAFTKVWAHYKGQEIVKKKPAVQVKKGLS